MGEWAQYNLGELIEVQNGYAFKSKDFHISTGTPIIKIKNIASGELRMDEVAYYPHSIEGLNRFIINKNDILIALTGSHVHQLSSVVGKVARYTKDNISLLNQRVGKITSLDGELTNEDFIFWFFKQWNVTIELALNAGGSASQANISGALIKKLQLDLPPLSEQKTIASVLSSLEDKIDLLHRQNQTLEQMAETLFQQWFVEDAHEDWKHCTVDELIDFNPKRRLAKEAIAPYVGMASLNNSTFHPESWYEREHKSGSRFMNGDTLLARITPCLENGKTAYITFLNEQQIAWGSTEYIVMRPKKGIHPFLGYLLAKNREFRDYAEGCMAGTSGRQRVDLNHLRNYEIQIPSQQLIQEFNNQAAAIVPKLIRNFEQINTLKNLRDTLLPKLMSGEVRVAHEKMETVK